MLSFMPSRYQTGGSNHWKNPTLNYQKNGQWLR